jgi:hypothetical protein
VRRGKKSREKGGSLEGGKIGRRRRGRTGGGEAIVSIEGQDKI